jgi:hypothetical protein
MPSVLASPGLGAKETNIQRMIEPPGLRGRAQSSDDSEIKE